MPYSTQKSTAAAATALCEAPYQDDVTPGVDVKYIRHLSVPALFFISQVLADVAYFESEPNNTPEDFGRISGAVTLYGTMTGADQDGYIWTVSDDDARKRWTFELHGIPEAKLTQVSVMQLQYAENGVDVVGRRKLFDMGTRDGTRPSIHEGMLFDPGEYVLGFVQAGSTADDGAYRFFIREQSLKVYRNPKGGASREDAHAIRPGRGYTTFEPDEAAWYSFDFGQSDAANRWAISVLAPVGKQLEASLHDANGEALISRWVDDKGRLAFKDLAPPVGTWYLKLETTQPGMIQDITTEITGVRVAGQEAEPNNERELANVVDLKRSLTGRIGDDDSEDYFRFTVEDSESPSLHTLRLDSAAPQKLDFCLMNNEWKSVQCRSGTPPLTMPDMLLSPGEWGLHLKRSKPQDYTITFESQGPVDPGREVEPNDTVEHAAGVPSKMRIKGRFSGDDTDYYQFYVTGEAQLWRFQVNGMGLQGITYVDGRGKEKASVKAKKGDKRIRLDNVFLLPGRHSLAVSGTDGDYTLLARALGPPIASEQAAPEETAFADSPPRASDGSLQAAPTTAWNPDGEVEPNDESNMQRLAVGQVRTGTLPDTEDRDHYRFFVANYDHLRLTITPPDDGSIHPYLYWYRYRLGAADDRQPGEVIQFEGLLPPGDYSLVLGSEEPSDKPYRLSLERLPRFGCSKNCEPNGMGDLDTVAPLPPDLRLAGVAQTWRDKDVYQLPAVDHDTQLLIQTAEPLDRAYLSDGYGQDSSFLRYDDDLGGYSIVLPANNPQRLVITGRGSKPYDAQLVFPGGEFTPTTDDLNLELSVDLEAGSVGAFLDHGQWLGGKIVARNTGATPTDIALEAVTSDHRWSTDLAASELNIEAGEDRSVAVLVKVPSDAWADHNVRVSVRAYDIEGRQVEAWSDISVNRATPAANAHHFWPIPDALRGGFNAAWRPFGASFTQETPKEVHEPSLRDDLVFPGTQMSCCRRDRSGERRFGPAWTLDLPGDEPLPVAGIAIDSFGIRSEASAIRQATLLLSIDGINFEEALLIEALPVLTEQHFVLPEPVPARLAQLRIEDTFESPPREVAVGEWKVILEPGFDLSGGRGFNIADPALGGHLVWTQPTDSGAGRILSDEDKSAWISLGKSSSAQYVIGFKRDRAAQIERIEWRYHDSAGEEDRNFRKIAVSVSEHSPIGPWRGVGIIEVSAPDASATLNLEVPTWARFVRFEAALDAGSKRSREPGVIRIWERPTGGDYFSVLTEWGEAGVRAFYESLQDIPQATALASNNDSRESAAQLAIGDRASGAVALGRLQNWYRVSVPRSVNALRLELTGDPTVRTVPAMEDAAGKQIRMSERRAGHSPGRHRYEAAVQPGQDVWINISEPPRNVIFSWDTSGSVSKYIPRIYNSVMAFSGEVQPHQEWVNLLPFGGTFLLSQWSDNPLVLQTVLNDFRQESNSSDAERTLYKAGRALGPRAGAKAVVIVTDAITPYFGDMWEPMAEIQPRIFGVGVGGAGIEEQNRFRDWAAVNGGDYRQLRYLGEMDVSFDRASTKMHRPAVYTLLVEGEFREDPGPGKLLVVAGNSQPQAAVELILDASGSMLQRIGGKRRINVAKEVLTEAIREHIPAGTPVALRVFGHKEVDSCRTDLEIPLAPLDPEAAAQRMASINAMNLARTPIADSLAAVESDLEGAETGAVVLVTDGEETCDGDPAAVIESLQEKGFHVNLNIVGFAIDDAELAAQFESWAAAGGGRYFAANDQGGLSEAIEEALRAPFTVYDHGGNEVATGQVGGDPVELERGVYRVVVNTTPQQIFEEVEVKGESTSELKLE